MKVGGRTYFSHLMLTKSDTLQLDINNPSRFLWECLRIKGLKDGRDYFDLSHNPHKALISGCAKDFYSHCKGIWQEINTLRWGDLGEGWGKKRRKKGEVVAE